MREPGQKVDVAKALFSTEEMSAVFAGAAHVRCMLRFEAALALAEARAGIIPQEAAEGIGASCKEELFDVEGLYREARRAGTVAIPLVRELTELVEGEGGKYVHWGATSQDAIDTAMMLQMREGIDLLIAGLLEIGAECEKLSERHRSTLMVGRTLLQHALPMTFGLKAARWLALVARLVGELRERRAQMVVQLGGAVGTLAAFGEKGLEVGEYLAEELDLAMPDLPWHTERDRVVAIATTVGVVAGAMGKIATDVVLMAQSEVGEVEEAKGLGKGGSSAMPQKHNPVDAIRAMTAARLAIGEVSGVLLGMVQEHERGVGGWQAEWASMPDLFCMTAGAMEGVREAVEGLQVDGERMKGNLEMTGGLVMAEALSLALAGRIGKKEANRLVQEVCKQVEERGVTMGEVVEGDSQIREVLSLEEIKQALEVERYLGSTNALIDRALAEYRKLREGQ